jgi:hypothetical protein
MVMLLVAAIIFLFSKFHFQILLSRTELNIVDFDVFFLLNLCLSFFNVQNGALVILLSLSNAPFGSLELNFILIIVI